MLVLGDGADACAFALAGATTVRCATRPEVVQALDLHARAVTATTIVFVSGSVYALARAEIDALRDRRGGPIVLVLPETAGAA
jgi:vacuolar-type H+-ATPase subunit F/Vma7